MDAMGHVIHIINKRLVGLGPNDLDAGDPLMKGNDAYKGTGKIPKPPIYH